MFSTWWNRKQAAQSDDRHFWLDSEFSLQLLHEHGQPFDRQDFTSLASSVSSLTPIPPGLAVVATALLWALRQKETLRDGEKLLRRAAEDALRMMSVGLHLSEQRRAA